MRVKPPSGGPSPVDQAREIGGPERAAPPESSGAVAPAAPTGATSGADPVADVARRLRAGEISPREAVELLIDDAVERQVGGALADREGLAAELKDLLRRLSDSDPYLSAKVRRISTWKP
jgi:hypothetical protein